jgi:molecular chaperone GrpE
MVKKNLRRRVDVAQVCAMGSCPSLHTSMQTGKEPAVRVARSDKRMYHIVNAFMEENSNNGPSELEECRKKCDEYLNNWKRERADFLNYKKEEVERIGMLSQYTKEETLLKIFPVLDSILLAEKQMPGELKNHAWVEGFLQTKNQIDKFLEREGIEKIEVMDKPFNPVTMEAVEAVEHQELQPDTVIEEVTRGYLLDGKVLRPAKVRISK